MKSTLIAIAFIGFVLSSCGNAAKQKAIAKKQYKYYCIMHPSIGKDKPGVCAKCGMQLVERDEDK
ncbi:heavy metal-binding domain-containing protein [Mucilaginibacter ximonensis]|uniref:Heavy metal-binding domain-containing protein n=1 Tax=Mucilaginibacter ximonensis TaxID=538021 RepID=A0ABW5Y6S2_9SPHI